MINHCRKYFVALVLLLCIHIAFGQAGYDDYIIPLNGKSFTCKITNIGTSSITYELEGNTLLMSMQKEAIKSYYSEKMSRVSLEEIERHCAILYPAAHEIYCTIIGDKKSNNRKKNYIYISYGQDPYSEQNFTGVDGKIIQFNSMEDALNKMSELGWQYVDAFLIIAGETHDYNYHVLMKKELGN